MSSVGLINTSRSDISLKLRLGSSVGASSNVGAINNALASQGLVEILMPGEFYINDSLVIYPNTNLKLGPNTTIKRLAGSGKAMLVNGNVAVGTFATVTLSVTASSLLMSVGWTAHGLLVGDGVLIQGAGQRQYNNVFDVTAVTDLNNFTVRLYNSTATTPTGTIKAIKLDRNITIEGGVWDCNNDGGGANSYHNHGLVLAGCKDLILTSLEVSNAVKYAINTSACLNYKLENITSTGSAEAIKQYGPAVNGHIQGLSGVVIDDSSTIQALEPAAFIGYQQLIDATTIFGDIYNIVVEDVAVTNTGTSSGSLVVFASNAEFIDNITYRNVHSISDLGNGISIKYGDGFTTGSVGRVLIEGAMTGSKSASNRPISLGCNITDITIKNFRPIANDISTRFLSQETVSSIGVLKLDGMIFEDSAWGSTGGYMINFSGSIDSFIVENCVVSMHSSGRFMSLNGSSSHFKSVVLRSNKLTAGAYLIYVQAGAPTIRTISLEGNRIQGFSSVVGVESLSNISLNGNYFDTIGGNGIIRPQTTAGLMARVYGSGNAFVSSNTHVNCPGTSTAEIYSFEIRYDVGLAPVIATLGQYAYHTSAVGGRNAANQQGPCVCNGTNWYALATGAAGVNTLIV